MKEVSVHHIENADLYLIRSVIKLMNSASPMLNMQFVKWTLEAVFQDNLRNF
jgi:hypothetical protein